MERKVVIVSTQRGWRGGEEQARLLATGLRLRGHQVCVMARRGSPFAERMQQEFGFEVHSFAGRGWHPAAIMANRRFLRHLEPDIIHLNDSHALTAISLAGLGLRQPRRVAARRVMFPIHSAFRYRRFCDQLVCVSNAVAKVALEAGIPESHIAVIHDGVDPARVRSGDRQAGRQRLQLDDGTMALLAVGALTEEKAYDQLLQAVREVVPENPHVRLLIAGEGPCRSDLEELIRQSKLDSFVQLLGHRDDIPDLMHATDLFVFAAKNEGLGSSVIDAMLAAKPVVCTASGGTPELLATNDTKKLGWLVPANDPQAMGEALLDAIGDSEERVRRAERAARHAHRHFVANIMVDKTIELYQNLLGQTQRKAA